MNETALVMSHSREPPEQWGAQGETAPKSGGPQIEQKEASESARLCELRGSHPDFQKRQKGLVRKVTNWRPASM